MRTKVLSANQRIVIGVVDQNFSGDKIAMFARTLKRVGLVLEVEERLKGLVLFAARRISTEDISVPESALKPIAKVGAA